MMRKEVNVNWIQRLLWLCILILGCGINANGAANQDNILKLADINARPDGQTCGMPVYLDNNCDITALQFTVVLPDPISGVAQTPWLSSTRTSGHTAVWREVSPGEWRVMLYSLSNSPIALRSGMVMTLPLRATEYAEEGSTYPVEIKDVIIAGRDGVNVAGSWEGGSVTIAHSADFEPRNLKPEATGTVMPGDEVTLSWEVANAGGLPTTGGFSEQLWMCGPKGESINLTTFHNDGRIQPYTTVKNRKTVRIPSIPGMDGQCVFELRIYPDRGAGEPEWLCTNNRTVSSSAITLGRKAYLNPAEVSLVEGRTRYWNIKLSRSGSTAQDEVFTVVPQAGSNENRFRFPSSVTIPAGESTVEVSIPVIPNYSLDDNNEASCKFASESFGELTAHATIADDALPSLTFADFPETLSEGHSRWVRVVSDRVPAEGLEISLSCSDPSRIKVPAKVRIENGFTEARFEVLAIDNDLAQSDKEVTVYASTWNWNSATGTVLVKDDDIPVISLTLSHDAVAEDAGEEYVTATLRREGNLDRTLTVAISHNGGANLYSSASSITFDRRKREVKFKLGPKDNEVVEGDRGYRISTAVLLDGCKCAVSESVAAGRASANLTVFDNDGPALAMWSTRNSIAEGDEAKVYVTRNTVDAPAVTVSISADPDNRFTYPSTVQFAANSRETYFRVKALTNSQQEEGDVKTSFRASAPGYSGAAMVISVTDRSLPDASLGAVNVTPASIKGGETFKASAIVRNTGTYELPEATEVRFWSQNKKQSVYLPTALQPGEETVVEVNFDSSREVGKWKVTAEVNTDRSVEELDYDNNYARCGYITTFAPFTATVTSDKAIYLPGEKAVLSGTATGLFEAGDDVEVYVCKGTARQSFKTTLDASGNFSIEYAPSGYMPGRYAAGACVPGQFAGSTDVNFDYPGLRVTKNAGDHTATLFAPVEGTMEANNPSGVAIGITEIKASGPEGLEISFTGPSEVPPFGTAEFAYKVVPSRRTEGSDWERAQLEISGQYGSKASSTAYLYFKDPSPWLVSSLTRIDSYIGRGLSRTWSLTLTNKGQGTAHGIEVKTPAWMSAISSMVSQLEPDQSVTIQLTATPDWGVDEPAHTGYIYIQSHDARTVSIPYCIRVVASSSGTLDVEVRNPATYTEPGSPRLEGANVKLVHNITGRTIASGATDAMGHWSCVAPEGSCYTVYASAPGHVGASKRLTIEPEKENYVILNLFYDVEETRGPSGSGGSGSGSTDPGTSGGGGYNMPYVTVTALDQIYRDYIRATETRIVRFRIENSGRATAYDVDFIRPQSGRGWNFEFPVAPVELDMAPGETRDVNVLVTKLGSTVDDDYTDTDACFVWTGAVYRERLGDSERKHRYDLKYRLKECTQSGYSTLGDDGRFGAPDLVPSYPVPDAPFAPDPEEPSGPVWTGEDGDIDNHDWSDSESVRTALTYCQPCVTEVETAIAAALDKVVVDGPQAEKLSVAVDVASELKDFIAGDSSKKEGIAESIAGLLTVPFANTSWTEEESERINAVLASLGCFQGARPDWIEALASNLGAYAGEISSLVEMFRTIYGSDMWTRLTPEDYAAIGAMASAMARGTQFDPQGLLASKPSGMSTAEYLRFMARLQNTLMATSVPSLERIDIEKVLELADIILANETSAIKNGYSCASDEIATLLADAYGKIRKEGESECASAVIFVYTTDVMEGEQLPVRVKVRNGHASLPMKGVSYIPSLYDSEGDIMADTHLPATVYSSSGFTANEDEGYGLDAASNGEWIFKVSIPEDVLSGENEQQFGIGGSIYYSDPFTGNPSVMVLNHVTVKVIRKPELALDFFLSTHILADDEATEEVEECNPAWFAMSVSNTGAFAKDLMAWLPRPELTNPTGDSLLSWYVLDCELLNVPTSLAIGGDALAQLGDVERGSNALWWIEGSKTGRFSPYAADLAGLRCFNRPASDMIQSLNTHVLVRPVKDEDGIWWCFLADDLEDPASMPDRLYKYSSSEGIPVVGCSAVLEPAVQEGEAESVILKIGEVKRKAGFEEQWVYGRVSDPFYGTREIERGVKLSNRTEEPLENFWFTDRNADNLLEPLPENLLHFCLPASDAGQDYQLFLKPVPDTRLRLDSVSGLPETDICTQSPRKLTLHFNKPLAAGNDLVNTIILNKSTGQYIECLRSDLTTVANEVDIFIPAEADEPETYTLTVKEYLLEDEDGFYGKGVSSCSWTVIKGYDIDVTCMPEGSGQIEMGEGPWKFGEETTLAATPNDGYAFRGWIFNDELIGAETELNLTVLDDMQLVAEFYPVSHTVTVLDSEGGTVTNVNGVYPHGAQIQLTAVPDEDWEVLRWLVNGDPYHDLGTDLDLTVDSDLEIKVEFKRTVFTQMISFAKGWNWISTAIEGKKSSLSGKAEWSGNSSDSEDAILPATLYKVKVSFPQIMTLRGKPCDDSRTIAHEPGINPLGYGSLLPSQPIDYFLTPCPGDVVMSQRGFCEYDGQQWHGSLKVLNPGEGYLYHSQCGGLVLTNPGIDDSLPRDWTMHSQARSFEKSIHITAEVVAGSEEAGDLEAKEDYEVVVYCGRKERGRGSYENGLWHVTAFGETGDRLTFKVVHVPSKETAEVDVELEFKEGVSHFLDHPLQLPIGVNLSTGMVVGEDSLFDVYSPEGLLIRTQTSSSDLKTLDHGLYILRSGDSTKIWLQQ